MPYDSNGNYTLPAIYKAKPATTIMTEQHNNPLEDIQAALNSVLLRNGSVSMTGNWNMGQNKVTNLADGTADTDAATVGQSLMLASTSTQTVTGPVSFSGKTTVPSVTDWASKQAVPASDADGRYIHSPAAPTTDFRILTISRNKATGGVWVTSEDGSNTPLQNAGDYATNSALTAETNRATTIESNLQSSKVNRAGDTMTGSLYINTPGGGVIASGNGGGDNVPGGVAYSAGFQSSYNVGNAACAIFRFINVNGAGGYASIWLTYGGNHELRFGTDDRLRTASGNVFALTSELSNYVPNSEVATYDGRVINLPYGHRIQVFTVTATPNSRITFPVAFSGAPFHVNIEVNDNIDCDHAYTDADSTGFTVRLWNNVNITLSIMAVGPK